MSSVPYLGHLPQDLLGTSALDFYHPNDLPELKKIYDSVIGRQGKSIRSKPYNFRAFNGCYVLLETDWTCFVNPWTKKLEFVAGHHRVLKGPSNPDVFASPPEGLFNDSLDPATLESTKKLHAEICTILTGTFKVNDNVVYTWILIFLVKNRFAETSATGPYLTQSSGHCAAGNGHPSSQESRHVDGIADRRSCQSPRKQFVRQFVFEQHVRPLQTIIAQSGRRRVITGRRFGRHGRHIDTRRIGTRFQQRRHATFLFSVELQSKSGALLSKPA